MSSINNKAIGTSSAKIRKISMLLKFAHEKVTNNQEIKRMIFYATKNPLSSRGKDYKDNNVNQPDVSNESVKDLITILPFNPDMSQALESYIFMNVPNGRFDKNGNVLYLDIYIISPSEYMEIAEGLRIHEIAQRLSDMFDGLYMDDAKYIDELGNLKFELYDFVNTRVSKTNSMLVTNLRFKIELCSLVRVRK